jgi:hypothetical protein
MKIARTGKVVALVLMVPAVLAGMAYLKGEQIVLGAEGYVFGYPLVIMDVTRVNSIQLIGPENQLKRVQQFPDASFKDVVRPNADTLYTTAFINMNQGPWVFEMPPNVKRYELMPFMDAWTNVFAAPGTRTRAEAEGKTGARFLLAGPKWTGELPVGLTLLRSPTAMTWLVGRTQTNGVQDYPLVKQLQNGLRLTKLSNWQAGRAPTDKHWAAATVKPEPPAQQMQAMDVETFYTRLASLMVDNPPAQADGPMMAKLQRIGVEPGMPLRWSLTDRWAIAFGRWVADFTIAKELKKPRELVRGWATPPSVLGQYGTFYNIRAVVAMVGLGANLPQDATYPNARVDAQGKALNGSHRYRLHFKADELPPVHAFWSVTAYGPDDYFIDNPLRRYALGDRDPLIFNADGSLDLWIQADAPSANRHSNWLPVKPAQAFLLNARLYWPKKSALNGSWGMPAVERID